MNGVKCSRTVSYSAWVDGMKAQDPDSGIGGSSVGPNQSLNPVPVRVIPPRLQADLHGILRPIGSDLLRRSSSAHSPAGRWWFPECR